MQGIATDVPGQKTAIFRRKMRRFATSPRCHVEKKQHRSALSRGDMNSPHEASYLLGTLGGVSESPTIVEQIHASGRQLVVAVSGGGSGAISALLQVPGASASVLEAIVPYASTALADWLGGTPDQYCSERTARAMAMAAFERARKLSDADPRSLRGIGATASLASTRPKRGPHRIHVAWQSADTTVVTSSTFSGDESRAEEEQLATRLILDATAEACGIESAQQGSPIGISTDRREQHAPIEWTELLLGKRKSVSKILSARPVLFPGAFNPLHRAHLRMAEVAAERCVSPLAFELSIANVDKPPLDFVEIADRVAQFPDERVMLTRAPTFVEKAEISPGCTFVVGIDTLVRIGDPIYYHDNVAQRDAAIAELAKSGCRFLAFGRTMNGAFRTLSDVSIPPALRALCDEVPESTFHEDVSSTELRGS
jgi:nicotinamide mononucleotide (NMN) deamidase PncC